MQEFLVAQQCTWASPAHSSWSSGQEALFCQDVARNTLPFCSKRLFLNSYVEAYTLVRIVKANVTPVCSSVREVNLRERSKFRNQSINRLLRCISCAFLLLFSSVNWNPELLLNVNLGRWKKDVLPALCSGTLLCWTNSPVQQSIFCAVCDGGWATLVCFLVWLKCISR